MSARDQKKQCLTKMLVSVLFFLKFALLVGFCIVNNLWRHRKYRSQYCSHKIATQFSWTSEWNHGSWKKYSLNFLIHVQQIQGFYLDSDLSNGWYIATKGIPFLELGLPLKW